MFSLLLLAAAGAAIAPEARADAPHYVTATSLNVRLCPAPECPTTSRLNRGDEVTVYERRDDWARVSAWYPAADERERFPDVQGDRVARWVAGKYLSKTRPAPLVSSGPTHPRILHMPRPGEHGLTRNDVRILRTYAVKLLESGACTSITNADKTKDGRYFVTCGNEYQNRYFRK